MFELQNQDFSIYSVTATGRKLTAVEMISRQTAETEIILRYLDSLI